MNIEYNLNTLGWITAGSGDNGGGAGLLDAPTGSLVILLLLLLLLFRLSEDDFVEVELSERVRRLPRRLLSFLKIFFQNLKQQTILVMILFKDNIPIYGLYEGIVKFRFSKLRFDRFYSIPTAVTSI